MTTTRSTSFNSFRFHSTSRSNAYATVNGTKKKQTFWRPLEKSAEYSVCTA